jgi:transmembrane sensor
MSKSPGTVVYTINRKNYMEFKNIGYLEILLTRYLEKKLTPEEKQQLYELLSSSDNEKAFKEILFSHADDFPEDEYIKHSVNFGSMYNQILSEIKYYEIRESEMLFLKKKRKVRRLLIQGLSLAAVFCIAFFFGRIVKKSDNRTISGPSIAVRYTEIKAPFGARSEIKLDDGTLVILNAGSTLKYNGKYNTNNRDLILDGEAFFKVAKNIDLPLIVNAGNINIRATGTEFNVKAYSDEEIVETTLIEGKIEISQVGENAENTMLKLTPNQKAIYIKKADRLTLEKIKEIEPLAVKPAKVDGDKLLISPKVNVDQETAWTKNKMIIRGESLENICVKLQRKYNVKCIFASEDIKKFRFTGILLDETLEQVLDVIKLTSPINYWLDGKTVLMVSNKEQIENYSRHLKKY